MGQGNSRREANRKYTAYVVPHTHWDRAWYRPFEEFRIKLVQTLDKLLEILGKNHQYKAFSFDGQTVVLEDYLQIRPEKEKAIRKHVANGRLAVGPWYVLPDEYLVSGEAIIRNLLMGHRIAGKFGRVMKVGYVPDPFGHISQMPQILRGFGMDTMIFSRGSGRRVRRAGIVFKWVGPDEESWVYAALQAGTYANLAGWGIGEGKPIDTPEVDYELALRQVESLIEQMENWKNPTRILLLNNGSDHSPAQPNVPEIIEYVNKKQDRAILVQGGFQDFVNALREDVGGLSIVSGELHEGMETGLLSGIFSTRMYIKQANAAAQTLLERLCEPLCTFGWIVGGDYPRGFLLYAWKELLKCHPHDDIGGCSVDEVHEDDMDRFRRVEQVGNALVEEALGQIAGHVEAPAGKGVMVYNPLSFPNTGEVTLSVPFRKRDLPANPRLVDEKGKGVPAVIRWSRFREEANAEGKSDSGELSIAFLATDVPPCGYRFYSMREGEGKEAKASLNSRGNKIENEFFVVAANSDGTLNLKEKETGIVHRGLNFFEDVEDAGDEYDHSPLPAFRSVRITSRRSEARIAVMPPTPYKQAIRISLELKVPRGLRPDRSARSGQTVLLPIHSTVTLRQGIRRVDFETTVVNQARDHRLRAGFPTGIRAVFAHAESKFDVVRRGLRIARYMERYYQPPVATKHMESFVDVHNGKRGFALLNCGLPEYEARGEAGGVTLYQTLFRSVGWLSQQGLLTRRRGRPGPSCRTPGAQMLGKWTFRYSVVPHHGSWEEAKLWRAGQSFTTPMVACLCEGGKGTLPSELSFVSIEPEDLPISAIKASENGEGIIVRFYNPTSRKVTARLHFFRRVGSAYLVRLDETRVKPLRVSGGNSVTVPVGGKKIVTVELHPSPISGE